MDTIKNLSIVNFRVTMTDWKHALMLCVDDE